MSPGRYRCWDVKLWWRTGEHSLYESGANRLWPESVGALEVISDVAEMRGVILDKCHSVDATTDERIYVIRDDGTGDWL